MKAFIINYNRLTLVQNIAEHLSKAGLDVYIIDNNSTHAPLLSWYTTCPYNVLRMDDNYGHTVFWTKGLFTMVKDERYILTDPDLDISSVPSDFVKILNDGLTKYPKYPKCGLSLKLDDLPDTKVGNSAKGWESKFWQHPLDEMYYAADVDTTLAMYRENTRIHTISAIRTAPPYSARHIPWYYTTFEELPEDEKYYYSSSKTYTSWSKYMEH